MASYVRVTLLSLKAQEVVEFEPVSSDVHADVTIVLPDVRLQTELYEDFSF